MLKKAHRNVLWKKTGERQTDRGPSIFLFSQPSSFLFSQPSTFLFSQPSSFLFSQPSTFLFSHLPPSLLQQLRCLLPYSYLLPFLRHFPSRILLRLSPPAQTRNVLLFVVKRTFLLHSLFCTQPPPATPGNENVPFLSSSPFLSCSRPIVGLRLRLG